MNRILYGSPAIPPQWIEAHCLEPFFVQPSWGYAHECVARVEGLCSYARAWISEALADENAAGIILALTCDQMRRAFEVLCAHAQIPCFLFNIPATWQTAQARQLYRSEMRRLGRFILGVGGCEPSADAMTEQMLKAGTRIVPNIELKQPGKIPLALVSPHATAVDPHFSNRIAQAGACILLDCFQPIRPTYDRRAVMLDPFTELVNASFDTIQDIFQRPNSGFYKKLDLALSQTPVKGLIVRRYLWCDLWHAEVYRLKQWSPVPVLDLEMGDQPQQDRDRLAMRIQSFMEMLQ
jgi:benzoyl-CoA reductase/2-hydroxyglutaryl-CoA dehydratase subunit BcrC/BadD/HgdB